MGGQDVLSGRTSPGDLAAFIFYAFVVAGSVGAISEVWSDLQRAAGATERLVELLQAPSEITDGQNKADIAASGDASAAIQLQNLTFSYPARAELKALDDVNITVQAGEMVAIVGPSGAGKSTLFDLMQRFYDPDAGAIRLDGVDLRDLPLNAARAAFGFVPQDPVLFSGSLRDNLIYGHGAATEKGSVMFWSSPLLLSLWRAFPKVWTLWWARVVSACQVVSDNVWQLHERCWRNLGAYCWMKPLVLWMRKVKSTLASRLPASKER